MGLFSTTNNTQQNKEPERRGHFALSRKSRNPSSRSSERRHTLQGAATGEIDDPPPRFARRRVALALVGLITAHRAGLAGGGSGAVPQRPNKLLWLVGAVRVIRRICKKGKRGSQMRVAGFWPMATVFERGSDQRKRIICSEARNLAIPTLSPGLFLFCERSETESRSQKKMP